MLQNFSDADLLLLLKQDDRAAFEELYDRYWLSLYSMAYKRLHDKETSSDIVHDIYMDLWTRRFVIHIMDLKPYLHTAVRNKIYTILSRGKAPAHFVEPFENMAVSALTADSFFEKEELRKLIMLWIATLPAKRREIFRLRFLEDRSSKEISEYLHISQKTVQNQLLLAIKSLRPNISHLVVVAMTIAAREW